MPRRARLASLHSWEKEIFVYCPGSGGQAAHHPVVPCSPALPPGLACLATSWGFLGPLPQTGDSYPHIWGSGLFSSIKFHLGLGVVPPSAAQMPRPVGAHLQCPNGSVPFLFHPLCYFLVLMGNTLGAAKKDSSSSVSWKEQCLHGFPHCRILEWP